jgi:hypothetical protein
MDSDGTGKLSVDRQEGDSLGYTKRRHEALRALASGGVTHPGAQTLCETLAKSGTTAWVRGSNRYVLTTAGKALLSRWDTTGKAVQAPSKTVEQEMYELVYDFDLKAPACVLLQAVFRCGASPRALNLFEPRHWLVNPTPGMRKIPGTLEQWKQAAAITAATWGDKRAQG